MKKMLIAAVVGSTLLGAGGAFAQGLPAGMSPPEYGSVWSANKIRSDRIAAAQKAEQTRHAQSRSPAVAEQNGQASRVNESGG